RPAPRRSRGTKRMVFGLLCLGGILPLGAGGLVIAQAFSNAQQDVPNPEFAPLAWHNLGAEEIFPEGFGRGTGRMEAQQGADTWARQGIAEEAACEEVLSAEYLQALEDNGCKTVLRATYADSSESVAATVSLVVLEDGSALEEVQETVDWFRMEEGVEGPLAEAYPVPGTLTEGFDQSLVGGDDMRGLTYNSHEAPYLVVTVAGPIDGRATGELPAPWDESESDETVYSGVAAFVGQEFEYAFNTKVEGR